MSRVVVASLAAASISFTSIHAQEVRFDGEGTIVGLDRATGTVTLDHGPIPGLMPPMRMRLSVLDPRQLRTLKVGDLVRFSLGSREDAVTIVTIEPRDRPGSESR